MGPHHTDITEAHTRGLESAWWQECAEEIRIINNPDPGTNTVEILETEQAEQGSVSDAPSEQRGGAPDSSQTGAARAGAREGVSTVVNQNPKSVHPTNILQRKRVN